jgi:hypothetical protein
MGVTWPGGVGGGEFCWKGEIGTNGLAVGCPGAFIG